MLHGQIFASVSGDVPEPFPAKNPVRPELG